MIKKWWKREWKTLKNHLSDPLCAPILGWIMGLSFILVGWFLAALFEFLKTLW